MKTLNRRSLLGAVLAGALAAGALSGCSGGTSGGQDGAVLTYDFNAGKQGWEADVADLPANYNPDNYQLEYAHANLPAPLDTTKKALRLTSNNSDDDLWYFLKRQITGLSPNRRYRVRFDVEIASNAPVESIGAGGGAGTDVIVKAGASAQEPRVEVRGGYRVFSLDKGNQTQVGRDAVILGHIAVPGDQYVYQLKQLDNGGQAFHVQSDSSGRVWAFIGTDSGFEGTQSLYYTRLKLMFTPE